MLPPAPRQPFKTPVHPKLFGNLLTPVPDGQYQCFNISSVVSTFCYHTPSICRKRNESTFPVMFTL